MPCGREPRPEGTANRSGGNRMTPRRTRPRRPGTPGRCRCSSWSRAILPPQCGRARGSRRPRRWRRGRFAGRRRAAGKGRRARLGPAAAAAAPSVARSRSNPAARRGGRRGSSDPASVAGRGFPARRPRFCVRPSPGNGAAAGQCPAAAEGPAASAGRGPAGGQMVAAARRRRRPARRRGRSAAAPPRAAAGPARPCRPPRRRCRSRRCVRSCLSSTVRFSTASSSRMRTKWMLPFWSRPGGAGEVGEQLCRRP